MVYSSTEMAVNIYFFTIGNDCGRLDNFNWSQKNISIQHLIYRTIPAMIILMFRMLRLIEFTLYSKDDRNIFANTKSRLVEAQYGAL